VRYHDVFYPAA